MDSNLRDCAFRSLVSSLRPIMNRVLGCTHREIEESVKLFYQYFYPAGPFAAKVAEANNYHLSKTLSLLFLPFLLQSGSLVLSDHNSVAVMNFIIASKFVTLDALKKLHTLRVSKWYSPFDEEIDYDVIKEFFPKIPELKVVILGSYTSDNIIDIIVKSCPKLEVLDCREDCWCTVSDSGLEALSSLKSLRYVLFSYLPDEYEEEDEKLLFSPKGIASLMMVPLLLWPCVIVPTELCPLDCAHTVLCPTATVTTRYCAQPQLCPHGTVPTRDCAHTGLCPHGTVPTRDCAHTVLCPTVIVPTRNCAHRLLCPHGTVPTRLCPHGIVPNHNCAHTVLCPSVI